MILLILAFLFQWIYYPYRFFADGAVRFHVISGLIASGKIESMKYSLVGPVFSAPLAYADSVFGGHYWLLRYNMTLVLLSAVLIYQLLKATQPKKNILIFIAILFFGSMYPGHVIHYYGEIFSSLAMLIGILLVENKRILPGWILMILSVGNMPVSIVALGLICLYKIFREKNLKYIALPFLAAAILILDAKIRMPRTTLGFSNYLLDDHGFGTVLPYSGKPGFSYPAILGILGELFSFGKGLLFYAPGLLFSGYLLRTEKNPVVKRVCILSLLYVSGLLLAYSKWWAWYGGWFWGPRFLLFASVPASLALAYLLMDPATKKGMKRIALAVTLWSFWVGVNGVVFGQSGMDICTGNNYALEHLCWYVPEFSALFHPFTVRMRIGMDGWLVIATHAAVWLFVVRSAITGTKIQKKGKITS